MYGQNSGVRCSLRPCGRPIFTKFCLLVDVPDVFLSFEFQKDRLKNMGAVGVEISPLPLKSTSLIQQLVATAQAVMGIE